jgi:hypothetical protein
MWIVGALMALASLPGVFLFPPMPLGIAGSTQVSTTLYVLDATVEIAAIIAQAQEDITIQNICFQTGTVTTGATLDLRIESVDLSNGQPSGSLFDTDTNIAHVLADADDNAWITSANLTANAVITKGEFFAIVVKQPVASFGNFQIANFSEALAGFPYGVNVLSTKQTALPTIAAKTSGGAFINLGPNYFPAATATDTSFNSGSTPDERGNVVTLPFKARASGIAFYGFGAAGTTYDLVLYDTDGSTVLAAITVDSDVTQLNSQNMRAHYFDDTTVTLSAGSQYRIALKPNAATNVTLGSFTVGEAGVLDAVAGGQAIHHTQQTNGGGWTETTTQRNLISLIIDQLDDGAGGGGGGALLTPPGMNGRLT